MKIMSNIPEIPMMITTDYKTFKIGDTMKLYLEPATGAVREKCARPGVLAAGIVLAALGLVVGLSILSVLL